MFFKSKIEDFFIGQPGVGLLNMDNGETFFSQMKNNFFFDVLICQKIHAAFLGTGRETSEASACAA